MGKEMSPDLNYGLKRLIRGLVSENHLVKRGFFLATVEVLARFKKQIDMPKLIKFIKDETKTSTTMKNPEINQLTLGLLMAISALVESQAYTVSAGHVQQDVLNMILHELIRLYNGF